MFSSPLLGLVDNKPLEPDPALEASEWPDGNRFPKVHSFSGSIVPPRLSPTLKWKGSIDQDLV